MLIKDVMTTQVRWFSPDTPIKKAARVMRDEGIGCIPIGENDRLIGMIADRDITCRPWLPARISKASPAGR